MNNLGDDAKATTLNCNSVNKITKYYGTLVQPLTISGASSLVFTPGVYRYVFNAVLIASASGLTTCSVVFNGLPTNCSINVYPINSGWGGQTTNGSFYLTPSSNQVGFTSATSATIPITCNATTAGNCYFKLIVEIFNESQ